MLCIVHSLAHLICNAYPAPALKLLLVFAAYDFCNLAFVFVRNPCLRVQKAFCTVFSPTIPMAHKDHCTCFPSLKSGDTSTVFCTDLSSKNKIAIRPNREREREGKNTTNILLLIPLTHEPHFAFHATFWMTWNVIKIVGF